jgi:DNA-binding NarL/FixJ family response regulator
MTVSIVLADDHPVVRRGRRTLLESETVENHRANLIRKLGL